MCYEGLEMGRGIWGGVMSHLLSDCSRSVLLMLNLLTLNLLTLNLLTLSFASPTSSPLQKAGKP